MARSTISKRLNHTRTHAIVQFQQAPTADQLKALEERGVVRIRPVPDHAYLVTIPAGVQARVNGVHRIVQMDRYQKVSRLLLHGRETDITARFLVEFHPDVEPWEARDIALREGFTVLENPDLAPHQLLLEGERAQLWSLAEWDEVAYLFPASWELEHGVPVVPCAGALTDGGSVGQYVETVGWGWDGPGLGRATLSYSMDTMTSQLPQEVVREEVQRALQEWGRYVRVSFFPTGITSAARNVNILFASGTHGDPYPFDGPGHVLAHTFYPAPPNPEPIAGDLHMDDDEVWRVGAHVDVYSIVLHELGHALGLGHSDSPNDVMYPYYRMVSGLSDGDVGAIRTLYEAAEDTSEPVEPLVLAITTPLGAVETQEPVIVVRGVTTGGASPISVTWRNNRGGSGTATGEQEWEVAALPLADGENVITVTATDSRGVSVARSLTANCVEPVPEEPPDPQPVDPPTEPEGPPEPDNPVVPETPNPTPEEPDEPVSPPPAPPEEPEVPVNPPPAPPAEPEEPATPPPAPPEEPPAEPEPPVEPVPVDTVLPTLRILYPPGTNILTSKDTIEFRGVASDNVGVSIVTWNVNTGASGAASGNSFWTTGPIPLLRGTNVVMIHAYDAAGNDAWRTVVVTRR